MSDDEPFDPDAKCQDGNADRDDRVDDAHVDVQHGHDVLFRRNDVLVLSLGHGLHAVHHVDAEEQRSERRPDHLDEVVDEELGRDGDDAQGDDAGEQRAAVAVHVERLEHRQQGQTEADDGAYAGAHQDVVDLFKGSKVNRLPPLVT